MHVFDERAAEPTHDALAGRVDPYDSPASEQRGKALRVPVPPRAADVDEGARLAGAEQGVFERELALPRHPETINDLNRLPSRLRTGWRRKSADATYAANQSYTRGAQPDAFSPSIRYSAGRSKTHQLRPRGVKMYGSALCEFDRAPGRRKSRPRTDRRTSASWAAALRSAIEEVR